MILSSLFWIYNNLYAVHFLTNWHIIFLNFSTFSHLFPRSSNVSICQIKIKLRLCNISRISIYKIHSFIYLHRVSPNLKTNPNSCRDTHQSRLSEDLVKIRLARHRERCAAAVGRWIENAPARAREARSKMATVTGWWQFDMGWASR